MTELNSLDPENSRRGNRITAEGHREMALGILSMIHRKD